MMTNPPITNTQGSQGRDEPPFTGSPQAVQNTALGRNGLPHLTQSKEGLFIFLFLFYFLSPFWGIT
jgi:hypothetical protein